MPGHDTESIIFNQPELREKYTCPKCNLLLKDAVQPSCGHWLCKSCADIIANENDPCCPKEECGEQFTQDDDYFPDRFVRKDILNLLIRHVNCGWEGKFSDLQEHLTQCSNVPTSANQSIFKQPELQAKYTCPKCNLLLRDAVQPSCGHWLCKPCADTIANENDPRCPKEGCRQQFAPEETYFPDMFVRKDVLNLLVHCKYSHLGCNWEGKFSGIEEHLAVECAHNLMECDFCRKMVPLNKLNSHKTECLKECPLSRFGCCSAASLTLQEFDEHCECNKYSHMQLIADKLEKPVPKVTTKGAEVSGVDLSSEFGSLVFSKVPTRNKLPDHLRGGSSDDSDHERSRIEEKVAEVQQELKVKDEEIAKLKSTVSKLEKAVRSRNADVEDHDFRLSLINSNHDGSMVWKIPQFSQRMSDAKNGKYTSIFSPPFYTGRYGYKMCLRLYIMGDGIGKGSYMSLFFVLMKGEFDNILQWPFTHKVTFKLINQNGGRDVVDTFQPDPMSSSFRKPKSDMNIASGCPRFVNQANLSSGGFIADDTIFIKCIVDTTTIKHP